QLSFCFPPVAPPDLYTLSLHDALPILIALQGIVGQRFAHGQLQPPVRHSEVPLNQRFLRLGKVLIGNQRERDLLAPKSVATGGRSEEHTSELQSRFDLVCRLLLEKKNQ